jgi:hypothetical protein
VPVFCNEVFSEEYEKCGAATIAGRLQQLEDRRDQRGNDKDFLVSPEGDSSLAGLKHGRPGVSSEKQRESLRPSRHRGRAPTAANTSASGFPRRRCLGHAFAAKTDKGIQAAKLAF